MVEPEVRADILRQQAEMCLGDADISVDLPATGIKVDVANGAVAVDEGPVVPVGGTTDHRVLRNRNAPDQHSISAITGLSQALDISALSNIELDQLLTND